MQLTIFLRLLPFPTKHVTNYVVRLFFTGPYIIEEQKRLGTLCIYLNLCVFMQWLALSFQSLLSLLCRPHDDLPNLDVLRAGQDVLHLPGHVLGTHDLPLVLQGFHGQPSLLLSHRDLKELEQKGSSILNSLELYNAFLQCSPQSPQIRERFLQCGCSASFLGLSQPTVKMIMSCAPPIKLPFIPLA